MKFIVKFVLTSHVDSTLPPSVQISYQRRLGFGQSRHKAGSSHPCRHRPLAVNNPPLLPTPATRRLMLLLCNVTAHPGSHRDSRRRPKMPKIAIGSLKDTESVFGVDWPREWSRCAWSCGKSGQNWGGARSWEGGERCAGWNQRYWSGAPL